VTFPGKDDTISYNHGKAIENIAFYPKKTGGKSEK